MTRIDLKYNTEKLKDWEFKSLSERNESERFRLKFFLPIAFVLLIFVLIFPYLPPRRAGNEYNPPRNLTDYFSEVSFAALVICLILFLTFGFEFVRNRIDEKTKNKKVGNFEIKWLINLGRQTLVAMNNSNFLLVKSNHNGLKNAKAGQIITVKKTTTNKILGIYFRDKSKFESE